MEYAKNLHFFNVISVIIYLHCLLIKYNVYDKDMEFISYIKCYILLYYFYYFLLIELFFVIYIIPKLHLDYRQQYIKIGIIPITICAFTQRITIYVGT